MAYINPKTDWEANDEITPADYNRIKNNLVYLNDLFNQYYEQYSFNPGPDIGIDEWFKASKFNMFEDCVEHFQRTGQIITFGERSYYQDNGHLPDFNQLNRLEKCTYAYAHLEVHVESLSLQPTSASLYPGNSVTIQVTILPANATNKNYLVTRPADKFSVSLDLRNSTFTLTAANDCPVGEYDIVVTSQDNSEITATLSVHVEPAVESVTITGNNSVNVGETTQLSATVLPSTVSDQSVVWSIDSGSQYATVSSSGVVTGVAQGTVVVKATSALDNTVYATKSLSVTPIMVSGISVSPSTLTFDILDDTEQLEVTVTPSNATNKNVTWTSSNTSVATVSSTGLVTAKGSGTATITCTAADGSGVSDTVSVTNSIRIEITNFDISPSSISINCDEDTYVRAINIVPANADPGTIRNWVVSDQQYFLLRNGNLDIGAVENTNEVHLIGKKPTLGSQNLKAYANERYQGLNKQISVEITGYPRSVELPFDEEWVELSQHGYSNQIMTYVYFKPEAAWQMPKVTSLNTSIIHIGNTASYDGYGTFKWYPVGTGTTRIKVESYFRSSVYAYITIHVE